MPAEARIVSLVPSVTELVCDLGLAPRLVGRTGFCVHPWETVRKIPKVGGTKDVNLISDLFTAARYGLDMGVQQNVPRTPWVCGDNYGDCDPNYPQATLVQWSCESNCNNLRNIGWYNPIRTGTTTPRGGDYDNWYGIGTIGGMLTAEGKAHDFTCSKCHSPHATGLPALLTQNCIDPSLGNFTVNGYTGTNLIANNCHRKTTASDGWHILAPGQ